MDPGRFAALAAGAASIPLAFHVSLSTAKGGSGSGRLGLLFSACLYLASFLWLGLVSDIVPEPYLDEVFHIPQAQKYCEGRFREWDDKITTPPGLYWISIVIPQAAKSSGLLTSYACDVQTLRATSTLGLFVLSCLAVLCRHEIEALSGTRSGGRGGGGGISSFAMHTGFNIALFPLLFFFSGLYYTDVISTAVVLAAFLNHLRRVGREKSSFASDVWTIVLGVASLAMRQTNVFWVVVFMGGLEAVHSMKTLKPVHDLPLRQASIQDMFWTVVSLVIAAACDPVKVLRQVWPHITILASFAVFVLWNGGVVLGDKSNHVATVHLAQMLYIWAFFAFFSLPLFVPYAFQVARNIYIGLSPRRMLAEVASKARPLEVVYLAATVLLSTAVVRYNTIIHPFTLADNRHYMFYVFRYTIRRAPWIRYALILPYTLSRWMVWWALSGFEDLDTSTSSAAASRDAKAKSQSQSQSQHQVAANNNEMASSTALMFLLATALSLVTAPLVEPRYFILPWVVWRLFLPAWRTGKYDVRLVLETLWFAGIQVATGYVFLYKPYVWRAEGGSVLDEGRLQRFMW